MSRILIIGGAGYIGRHVARSFLDNNDEVVIFDKSNDNIPPDVSFVYGDILNYTLLLKTMSTGFDVVIHLASLQVVSDAMKYPEKYSVNNICGSINILNAIFETGIKNIIFSSTSAVYGHSKTMPIEEDHPTEPINFYGFTKLEIERLLTWYDRLHEIKYVTLRYLNAAGFDIKGRIKGLESNLKNLFPAVMQVAIGLKDKVSIYGVDYDTEDGTCVRDYVHVSDLADAHLLAFDYLKRTNESLTVNLGSEKGLSVKSVIDMTRKITGHQIPVDIIERRVGDPAIIVASSKKAEKILNWKAKLSDCETMITSSWVQYKQFKKELK